MRYQLTSYLARYVADGARVGARLHPLDPDQRRIATAEARGP